MACSVCQRASVGKIGLVSSAPVNKNGQGKRTMSLHVFASVATEQENFLIVFPMLPGKRLLRSQSPRRGSARE